MGKILVVAEKYSVAETIAGATGCLAKRSGYFEGPRYVVSWLVGHVAGLYDPEDYDPKLKVWTKESLPIIPEQFKLKTLAAKKGQYDILKQLMNSSDIDSLICATDPGREGEVIFRYAYILSGTKKSFKRLWLKSNTYGAIIKAFENLRDGNEYNARNIADWLVGFNASRAFSLEFNMRFSVGRVQTPALNMIVEKEKKILAFRPETYYRIKGIFKSVNHVFEATYNPVNETLLKNRRTTEKLLETIESARGNKWLIERLQRQQKYEAPPPLYDLTTLQHDCGVNYGFTAKKTLDIAQELYEAGLITYPRTDSKYLPAEMEGELKKIINQISGINAYSGYIRKINTDKLKNVIDDSCVTDHHAIVPTDKTPGVMKDENIKVYGLIVRRFIAAFMKRFTYIQLDALITHDDVEGTFNVTWKKAVDYGWKEVYGDDGEEIILPSLQENGKASLVSVKKEEVKQKPPSRYTDASLITSMEKAGLGTVATRAAIIEKIIKTGYVKREGIHLVPTKVGIGLIEILDIFPDLKSPELTAEWEAQISLIEKGSLSSKEFIGRIRQFTWTLVQECKKTGGVHA